MTKQVRLRCDSEDESTSRTARRNEIVAVAASMIAKHGYEGTKIAAIASELGILSGSLYHHIRSKQDLLFWIMERAHVDLEVALSEFDLELMPADEALRTVIRTHIITAVSNVALGAVSESELSKLDDDARELIMAYRRSYQTLVTGIVRRGQQDGTFRTEVPELLAALAAMSLANSTYRWFRPGRSWSAEAVSNHYATIIVEGLLAPRES